MCVCEGESHVVKRKKNTWKLEVKLHGKGELSVVEEVKGECKDLTLSWCSLIKYSLLNYVLSRRCGDFNHCSYLYFSTWEWNITVMQLYTY